MLCCRSTVCRRYRCASILVREADLPRFQEAEIAAVEPVFGELRSVLAPLGSGIGQASLSHVELKGALWALKFNDACLHSLLHDTLQASTDLEDILKELTPSAKRLSRSVMATESLFYRAPPAQGNECIASGSTLAEHLTKLVGGVQVAKHLAHWLERPLKPAGAKWLSGPAPCPNPGALAMAWVSHRFARSTASLIERPAARWAVMAAERVHPVP